MKQNIPVRPQIPARQALTILGVPFDSLTLETAIRRLDEMILSGRPHYVATANIDFLVQARKDLELRRVLFEADLVLCDGTPLVWVSRLLGQPLPERVAGSDLVPRLIQHAFQQNYSIFFLGGEPQVTAKAVAVLKRTYPGLNIAGYYSPPFRSLLELDHDEIARRIRSAEPDLVFVSFGCPKAEKWMAMHYHSLGVPVMMGVGGTIDFLAGVKKRAPAWMQRAGIEWLFRLLQEPRRLMGRYAKDFYYFIPAVLSQWWQLRRGAAGAESWPECSIPLNQPAWVRFQVPARLDRQVIARAAPLWTAIQEQHCLLDLSTVKHLDSTALGWLSRLRQQLLKNGRHLVLLDPSPPVRRALRGQRLESFFLVAQNIVQARELIQQQTADPSFETDGDGPWLCRGEITVRNAGALWEQIEERLLTPNGRERGLTLDLSQVRFIDSGGVRVLLRARTLARDLGSSLRLVGLQPEVENILCHARAEQLLSGGRA